MEIMEMSVSKMMFVLGVLIYACILLSGCSGTAAEPTESIQNEKSDYF